MSGDKIESRPQTEERRRADEKCSQRIFVPMESNQSRTEIVCRTKNADCFVISRKFSDALLFALRFLFPPPMVEPNVNKRAFPRTLNSAEAHSDSIFSHFPLRRALQRPRVDG